jgi:2,5-diamino-6-(ribosylamino)-4(3H)-pyrimidinone 5'-phosphate reductase
MAGEGSGSPDYDRRVPAPRVIVHAAVSLDGKIDGFEPDVGTYYDTIATWDEDATLCGSETILAAAAEPDAPDAELPTAAEGDDRPPLLAVVDSRGRVRSWSALLSAGRWSTGLALCSATTPPEHLEYLTSAGVDIAVAGNDRVDLERALGELADRGVDTARVDAGPTLNALLWRAGLVDELSVLVHPAIAGAGRPFLDQMDARVSLRLIAEERRGQGLVWLRYAVAR